MLKPEADQGKCDALLRKRASRITSLRGSQARQQYSCLTDYEQRSRVDRGSDQHTLADASARSRTKPRFIGDCIERASTWSWVMIRPVQPRRRLLPLPKAWSGLAWCGPLRRNDVRSRLVLHGTKSKLDVEVGRFLRLGPEADRMEDTVGVGQ